MLKTSVALILIVQAVAVRGEWPSIDDDAGRPRRRTSATRPTTQAAARQPWEFANIFKSFTK